MLFDDTYKTIEKKSEGEFKDKGSKFISLAYPVSSEKEVKQILTEVRNAYSEASHHCYAYIIGHDKLKYHYSDDKERFGMAGKPIFHQIQLKDLTNTLVIVVRYFGGTILGIPGLINAYKRASLDALNNASYITKTIYDVYQANFDYPVFYDVMNLLEDNELEIYSKDKQ